MATCLYVIPWNTQVERVARTFALTGVQGGRDHGATVVWFSRQRLVERSRPTSGDKPLGKPASASLNADRFGTSVTKYLRW
jgi:hypothetical protein